MAATNLYDDHEDFTAGDEDIIIDESVLILAAQIEAINGIDSEVARLEAAKSWAAALNGGEA